MDTDETPRALITALPASRRPGAVPTAPVGRLLARQLLEAGLRVRVVVPTSEAVGWPERAEVVEGSGMDPAAVSDAFTSVDRVFLAGLVSLEYDRMRELTNLLLNGPLRRVVVLSSHGSDFETAYSSETWQWLAFERALQLGGATWVHLRPAGLFANAMSGGYPITGADWMSSRATSGPVREFLPDVEYPFMSEGDLASIAALLLLDDAPAGDPVTRKLDVVGCLTSARERIRCLNEMLGVDLRLEPLRHEYEARSYWQSQGWPDDTIAVTLYAMQAFQNASEETRQAVRAQVATAESFLGRPPQTFRDWLSDREPAWQISTRASDT